jgi:hypothetical protein
MPEEGERQWETTSGKCRFDHLEQSRNSCQEGEMIVYDREGHSMKITLIAVSLALAGILGACSSPQDDAARAQENVSNERLKLVEQYKECINDASGDAAKVEACDSYLGAAQALQ